MGLEVEMEMDLGEGEWRESEVKCASSLVFEAHLLFSYLTRRSLLNKDTKALNSTLCLLPFLMTTTSLTGK
jgi:hypothetical protein